MQESNEIATTLGETFLVIMRQAVRDEIRILIWDLREKDRLLTAQEAAQILSVSPDWFYRNARKLPFTRRLGPRMLRFSHLGIEKWIGTRSIS